MTAKQILDAFSETLMQDERILSPRERELLTNLLQNSKSISGHNPELESAVSAAIARSVGETVAQRAFTLLGGSIVEKILAPAGISSRSGDALGEVPIELRSPQPPTPSPQPPTPSPQPPTSSPQPPTGSPQPPTSAPRSSPQPPTSRALRPSGVLVRPGAEQTSLNPVQLLDRPTQVHAQCVVLDEFLAPQELDELMSFVLQHEPEFQTSEVFSPTGEAGVVDYSHRRSRVLMDAGKHQEIILDRIRGVLPSVLHELGMEDFTATHAEAQITASNDGDFFRAHSDDADASIASRHLTFVYFFHREPRQFEGGDLQLHDSCSNGGQQHKTGDSQVLSPKQNQIVFFPSALLHEITPVACATRAFADSRFTLNGWLHK
jgi:Rps23 Pro-64 3,4-dihydroxylase Tpa1-like proline 4-hydroxylase